MKTGALIAKEKDVAEAFFDQITTEAYDVLERIGLGRKRSCIIERRILLGRAARSSPNGARPSRPASPA